LLWDELFELDADELAVELLDWLTGPKFSTATFGEAFTEVESDFAYWSIEFDAFCDWSIDCDPSLPSLPQLQPWPLVWP
jgi:hypothetical protein